VVPQCAGDDAWPPPTNAIQDDTRLREATLQLVDGLCAIHCAGKVHRDVKPSNVLVDRSGRVVLVDFGLVKDVSTYTGRASEHEVAGTFAYMAPELLLGYAASAAADWYSVGVMLLEALTGRLPFGGAPAEVLESKQQPPVFAPAHFGPAIAPAFVEILRRLLDPRPGTRAEGQALRNTLRGAREMHVPVELPTPPEPLFVGARPSLERCKPP
jgi:serine/threonine protein kinase